MKSSVKFIIAFFLLIIAVFLGFLFISGQKQSNYPDYAVEKIYSDEPRDWIGRNGTKSVISVEDSTKEQGVYYGGDLHYVGIDGNELLLNINGYYNAQWFNRVFFDENNNILFKIGNEMNPNDNVPEGFALMKEEKNGLAVYLFIDEDWKKKTNNDINIIWSEDLSENDLLKTIKFDFSKENNGIYVDKITDNISWLEKNSSRGGIVFGEISLDEFKDNQIEKPHIVLK